MQEGLLHTRFDHVAKNTIDYWMKRDTHDLTYTDVNVAIEQATWSARSTCQLYLHVPYCAQHCSFCAFSGGNSLDFKSAERYSRLLVWETQELVRKTQAAGKHIRGVNIGGGSPDLLRGNIRHVLSAIRNLPGVDDTTEISVELTLSTAQDDFLDALCEFNVTKASFGIQAIDPGIRKDLRMPEEMRNFERVSKRLARGVPVVNVDLMTGLPGQTVTSVVSDLQYFMNHPFVNSISTVSPDSGSGTEAHWRYPSRKRPSQTRRSRAGLVSIAFVRHLASERVGPKRDQHLYASGACAQPRI